MTRILILVLEAIEDDSDYAFAPIVMVLTVALVLAACHVYGSA